MLKGAKKYTAGDASELLLARFGYWNKDPDAANFDACYFKQVMRDHPELKKMADKMRELFFVIQIRIADPSMMAQIWRVENLTTSSPRYAIVLNTFKTFALQYASVEHPEMLQETEEMFANYNWKKIEDWLAKNKW